MNRQYFSVFWFVGWLAIGFGSLASTAEGQESSGANGARIVATGSHEIKLEPTKIRLVLPIRIESREGEMALKRFRDHRMLIEKELAALGAIRESIDFKPIYLSVEVPGVRDPEAAKKQVVAQAIQMRNMNPHMQAQFNLPDLGSIDSRDLPRVFAAETVLTVDWKLDKGLNETAILLPTKLKTVIDEKDLSGNQFTEVLSKEEQAMIHPLMGNQYYSVPQNQTSDNRIQFVAEMSEVQEQEGVAAAMKQAEKQATILALAAGKKLGKLQSIQRNTMQEYSSTTPVTYVVQSTSSSFGNSSDPREAINANPANLRKTLSVQVIYEME